MAATCHSGLSTPVIRYHRSVFYRLAAYSVALLLKRRYHDQWNDEIVTVPYEDYDTASRGKALTAAYMPLKVGDRVFGVLNFEFDRQVFLNKQIKEEASELAEAVSTIIWLRQTTEQWAKNTDIALQRLKERIDFGVSSLKQMNVFVANSSQADPVVMRCIKSAIKSFSNLQLIHWEDLKAPGSISEDIELKIDASSFGICYMSEYDQGAAKRGEKPYRDNSNVMFEAGMLHAMKKNRQTKRSLWIIVREDEKLTTDAPFDVEHMRMVVVKRDIRENEVVVDEEDLTHQLKEMIDWILTSGM